LQLQSEKILKIIESHTQFVLTTHVNPDGDGLGTEVALALYLKSRGKQATILNYSATPENYLFLDQLYPILKFDPALHKTVIEKAEVIIVLDTNHPDRLLAMKPFIMASHAIKVCIDHHLEPGEFADLYILDEQATATGEIIYFLFNDFGEKIIDCGIAIALYTAIMTDTGSFRYPKTDSEVHDIIAHLIRSGADPGVIYENVYERGSVNRMHLLGMALADLKLMYDGKLAYIVVTQDMFKATGTTEEDTDAFIPYTLAIDGVQIGLMFSEINNVIKVGFRSKGNIRINELAKEFGGNGHQNAAGARITQGRLDEIILQVLKKAGAYIR
jgi:phosphoesterase RecJ-like protein